jgi:hypothetical protein
MKKKIVRKRFKGTRKAVDKNADGIVKKFHGLIDADPVKYDGLYRKMVHQISIVRELSPRI